MRYLTKSRFKLALDCPSKLFYCNKPNEYADDALDDPFLAALAEGGFQVGELAKFLFCDDPIAQNITIEEKGYDTAVAITNEKLFGTERPVIAEAAFRYENLFVRVDITTREEKVINIYEVKAKSWKEGRNFFKHTRDEFYLEKKYLPYLYDIAFQKYVVQQANPGYQVKAHLIFANADAAVSINGLNELFRIDKTDGRKSIEVAEGTTRSMLGTIPLKMLPVDDVCDYIFKNPVQVDLIEEYSFEEIIHLFSDAYQKDERIWSHIGRKCKDCQFTNAVNDPNLKSGFNECWKHWTGLSDEQLKMPLTLELWGGQSGGNSIVDAAIKRGKYLLQSVEESDYWPKKFEQRIGLHPAERRQFQINKARNKDESPYLDREGLKKVFDELEPPYHFIDFETSMVALPFHNGRKPYEATAFQYSYHLMDEKGNIQHKNEYISLSHEFPNYEFVRALKNDLHGIKGTIFRYHNHENTYLGLIYDQLIKEPPGLIPDREELIDFIREISHRHKENGWEGPLDMQDLWQLVISYYYSPAAKGSNSIKDILPAVIRDSRYIREKYAQPIYGTDLIPSLNFKNHIWISEEHQMNPYKTLPQILEGYTNESLDQFFEMDEELRDGGAAMMAYAYLQFGDLHADQRELIRKALLRYCELDTMAMVMIWEFFSH